MRDSDTAGQSVPNAQCCNDAHERGIEDGGLVKPLKDAQSCMSCPRRLGLMMLSPFRGIKS